MEIKTTLIGQIIITVGLWGGILGYPLLQYIAVKRMYGLWRVLAFWPFAPMTFVLVVTLVGFYQQSNLWPIVLIFISPLILVYLVVVLGLHWISMRGINKRLEQPNPSPMRSIPYEPIA